MSSVLQRFFRGSAQNCFRASLSEKNRTHIITSTSAYLWFVFEWLHDFHLFVQTNPYPNPNPNPNLNQFLPNPNLNLTSIRTLPLNSAPHRCSAGPLVHLTTCRPYSELSEQWAGPWRNTTLLHLSLALYLDCHSLFSADHGNFSEHVFLFAALHCASQQQVTSLRTDWPLKRVTCLSF